MNDGPAAGSPAADASAALGGMVMGEMSPFPADSSVPDASDDIASIFGLGAEAGKQPNAPEGGPEGGASPSAAPAADRPGEQAQPATPPVQQPQPGQQGDATQAPAQQPQAAPAAPAAAPANAQPSSPSADVQALTAQVQALIAQNAQLQSQLQQGAGTQVPQPGPNGQQGQQPPADVDPHMDYRFAIPDDVAGAIFNEDPNVARQGMSHLVNSIMRIVHERTLKSVTERILPQQLGQFQQNLTLTQQQEQMRQEYFNEFKDHNDPGIRLIVAQEAQQMWTENPALAWDHNARNALGARVNARLGRSPASQQQQQQQPISAQQGTPAPRPAAQMGASNRQPAANADEGQFMVDVLTA